MARTGIFRPYDLGHYLEEDYTAYLSPVKWETPYAQSKVSDRFIFGPTDETPDQFLQVEGETQGPLAPNPNDIGESLKIGLYFAECFFYE